jgi:hypothetical protein
MYQAPSTPYSFRCSFDGSDWGGFVTRNGTWNAYLGGFPLLPPSPTFDVSSQIDQAVTQAWSNVKLSETQALVSLGEARETIDSVFSMTRRLIKVARAIKKLDVKYLAKQLSAKELSDRYMEFRYSLRPLVGEVTNTLNAINSIGVRRDRLTFRGAVVDMYDTSNDLLRHDDTSFGVWEAGDWKRDRTLRQTRHTSVRVRAGVLTETWSDDLIGKFGLLDIPESTWELVPFSFVVDWFFNVGAKVAAFSYNYGLRPLASWVTTELVTIRKTHVLQDEWRQVYVKRPGTIVEKDQSYLLCTSIEKMRTPNPELRVLPSFNLRLNAFKLLDLIIMGRNLFRSL